VTAVDATITTDAAVIDAITGQQLVQWSSASGHPLAPNAAAACKAIGTQVAGVVDEVAAWLAERGHVIDVPTSTTPRQRHDVAVGVASVDEADAIASMLGELGFVRWDRWTGAAARSFRTHAAQITVARTGDHSTVLRLRWAGSSGGGRGRRLLRSIFRPTHGDWTMVSLPAPLWRAYSLVRPVRLALERTGLRDRHAAGLGPFLSTPQSLIPALFALADLGPNDTLLDIGCGDGRIALAAAQTHGCRAIGIEHDAELVARGRRAAAAAGLGDRVTIDLGDARKADLSEVTVAVMFLPMDVAAELVSDLVDRLPADARLLMHEQTPFPTSIAPSPERSSAVIASDAVTVAHRWTA